MSPVFEPGASIGILGGGQLGRMLGMAARRMGYGVVVLDPHTPSPAGQCADEQIVADFTSGPGLDALVSRVAVATYEFENIDADFVEALAERVPVYPSAKLLRVSQHRVREKQACRDLGIATAPFAPVLRFDDLVAAAGSIGLPAVLKTATGGYDGKGQHVLSSEEQLREAFEQLGGGRHPLILEGFIRFDREVSVVVARDLYGHMEHFPVTHNVHVGGILSLSVAPADLDGTVAATAVAYAKRLAEAFELVGVLAVEFFVTPDGEILFNEMAPRPHNSAHYTIEAVVPSQFEQHVRAICGLPLGSPALVRPAAMANLLGDDWLAADGRPDFSGPLRLPETALHLYGKTNALPGRKMGHITALGERPDVARERVLRARRLFRRERP